MLAPATPYPQPGSYALLVNTAEPPERQRAELARIVELPTDPDSLVLVAFPLRDGASGNRRVERSELIDGTPLDGAEARELTDLQRELRGDGTVGEDGRLNQRPIRSARLKGLAARRDLLRSRMCWAPRLERELQVMASHQARKDAA